MTSFVFKKVTVRCESTDGVCHVATGSFPLYRKRHPETPVEWRVHSKSEAKRVISFLVKEEGRLYESTL